jgi:hypothetical protein
MKQGITSIHPFVPILDVLLQALVAEPREADCVRLQNHTNDLHSIVQTLSNGAMLATIFSIVSRFVSFVQILVAQIGSLTGKELRIL